VIMSPDGSSCPGRQCQHTAGDPTPEVSPACPASSFDSAALALTQATYHTRPDLLGRLFDAELPPCLLRRWLWPTWRYRPDGVTGPNADTWRRMFLNAGFQTDGRNTRRPRLARRLFRGATLANSRGLSWTTHPAIAAHFAQTRQRPGTFDGRVWTAIVAPHRFLATGTDEAEFLIKADNLTITEIDTSALPRYTKHPRFPFRLNGQ
jgi:hypothetical protein